MNTKPITEKDSISSRDLFMSDELIVSTHETKLIASLWCQQKIWKALKNETSFNHTKETKL